MSISAISSVYTSYQKYQTQFFGGTISESQFDFLMKKYGITATGDTEKDIQALYQAMYEEADAEAAGSVASSNANSANKSQSTDAQSSTQVPWASLMSRIGLAATGELSNDYALFNAKISKMQASAATSPQQKALILQLEAEASVVFVQPQQQTSQVAQAQSVSGADIRAQLNRLYFFS